MEDDEASFVWRDQRGVHKIVPGRGGTKVVEEEFKLSPPPEENHVDGVFSFERREYNDVENQKQGVVVISRGRGVFQKHGHHITLHWDKKLKDQKLFQEQYPTLLDKGDLTLRVTIDSEERVYVDHVGSSEMQ